MGAFQDCLDNAKTFKASASQLGSYLTALINRQVDPTPTVGAVTNAVHTIATSTQTAGNMTLTVLLRSGETFTTGSILFSATAGTIETAIDVAAASVVGWTNGDISVSGGAVNAAPVVLTFDGASVAGLNHSVTVLNDVDGTGGAWGVVTLTTAGQTARYALSVLVALGALDSGTIAEQSATASNSAYAAAGNIEKVPQWALRCLAREMAAEDGNNDTYHSVIESLSIQDRARKAQYLGGSSVV